jgi:hypothetical protein
MHTGGGRAVGTGVFPLRVDGGDMEPLFELSYLDLSKDSGSSPNAFKTQSVGLAVAAHALVRI